MPTSQIVVRRAFWAGVAFFAGLVGGCDARGEPAGDTLLPGVIDRLERDRDALRRYSYVESSRLERRDGGGALRSQALETSEIFIDEGRRMKRPRAPGIGAGPADARPVEDHETGLDIRELAACFRFDPIGAEAAPSQEVIRVTFTVIEGCLQAGGPTARILDHLTGDLWIDLQELEVIRLEGRLQRPVTFGLGLLGRVETFEVELRREAVGPGVYATTYLATRATGRVLLARTFDRRTVRARSHFSADGAGRLSAITSSPSRPPASDQDPRPRSRS